MNALAWLVIVGSVAGIAFLGWRALSAWKARSRSEEDRLAEFMGVARSAAAPATPPLPANTLQLEKLLFEAATKAAEAGEPALAIELHGRLLERFPASAFAEQARSAIKTQKSRLGKS